MTLLERILQALRAHGSVPGLSRRDLMRCMPARLIGCILHSFGSSHCREAKEQRHVQQPE